VAAAGDALELALVDPQRAAAKQTVDVLAAQPSGDISAALRTRQPLAAVVLAILLSSARLCFSLRRA